MHPRNKKVIGRRLANAALAGTTLVTARFTWPRVASRLADLYGDVVREAELRVA